MSIKEQVSEAVEEAIDKIIEQSSLQELNNVKITLTLDFEFTREPGKEVPHD